jgi:hypothetical protein
MYGDIHKTGNMRFKLPHCPVGVHIAGGTSSRRTESNLVCHGCRFETERAGCADVCDKLGDEGTNLKCSQNHYVYFSTLIIANDGIYTPKYDFISPFATEP